MSDYMVPNPYLQGLRGHRERLRPHTEFIRWAFNGIKNIMEAGAWKSSRADEVYALFADWQSQVRSAAEMAEATVDQAISAQLEEVPLDAWQVRWRSML